VQSIKSQRLALIALAAVSLIAMTNAATAGGGTFTRGCAARDLQVQMMIEDRQNTKAVSADKLNDAMLALLHARIVCRAGQVLDALALYEGIARSITPNPVLSGRAHPTEIQ
jgi:hypothetical protein